MTDEEKEIEYEEMPIKVKILTTPETATEMVSTVVAACLALWANKNHKIDEFAAWMALPENKDLLLMGCGDPEHVEPHYPFQRQMDGDMADQFLYYFINQAIPRMRFIPDDNESEPSGPLTGPYL